MLTEPEINTLVRRIMRVLQPERVILFGSYAKGTAASASDVDLLVIKETPLPPARRAEDLLPMLQQMLIPVDVHIYTPEEVTELAREPWSFIHSVLQTGRTLYPEGEIPGDRTLR